MQIITVFVLDATYMRKTKTTNDNPNVTKTLTKILSACPFNAEKAYQTRLVFHFLDLNHFLLSKKCKQM